MTFLAILIIAVLFGPLLLAGLLADTDLAREAGVKIGQGESNA